VTGDGGRRVGRGLLVVGVFVALTIGVAGLVALIGGAS
jgi:hypothetical protein